LKYPNLFDGAVASSDPVQAELDFYQYLEVVTASLTTMSGTEDCVNNIADAVDNLQDMLYTSSGRSTITDLFNLCAPLTDDSEDIANFLSSVAGNFMGAVQYNNDNRAFEGATDVNVTIDAVCGYMNDDSVDDVVQRYANVNSFILMTYQEPCLDASYADLIAAYANISLDGPAAGGGRQWVYQTCTEFGYYQTSDASDQPFGTGFPIDFSIQQCTDIYGAQFTQNSLESGIAWTLTNYGGNDIGATNVVLPNGSIDPWHALGILMDLSPTVNAVLIDGTAHCADMYPASDNDPITLTQARIVINQHVSDFIQQAVDRRVAKQLIVA